MTYICCKSTTVYVYAMTSINIYTINATNKDNISLFRTELTSYG